MKQKKDLDNVLNDCLERLFRGETVEQCLRRYPEQAAELEPLLRTATVVKKATTVSPDAIFRARAREEFHTALQDMKAGQGFRFLGLRVWATATIGIAMAVLLMGSGTVMLADNSMPGDALYPVKLAAEQAQVAMTFSEAGKAELYGSLAEKRVNEIVYAAAGGDIQQVDVTSQRMDNYLAKVSAIVQKTPATGNETASLLAPSPAALPANPQATVDAGQPAAPMLMAQKATTNDNTPAPDAGVTGITPGASGGGGFGSDDAKEEVLTTTQAVEKTSLPLQTAKPVDISVTAPGLSGVEMKDTGVKDAFREKMKDNLAKLKKALETAPESARPALERAFKKAEASYREVLGEDIEDGSAPGKQN